MIASSTRFIDYRDQIGSILVVAPVTLIYAIGFMKYVVANASANTTTEPPEAFDVLASLTMYLMVVIFCASLWFVVLKFVFFSAYQVNEFKMWLGASETAFGALIGLVFDRLFGVVSSSSGTTQSRKATKSTSPGPNVLNIK
jgi:hypothetical protein